jgi:hypothetical protein
MTRVFATRVFALPIGPRGGLVGGGRAVLSQVFGSAWSEGSTARFGPSPLPVAKTVCSVPVPGP